MRRIVICTTAAETFVTILNGQPRFLAKHFDLHLVTTQAARFPLTEGVPVRHVPMHRGIKISNDLYSIFLMVQFLAERKPFIVHSYTPKAGLVAMIAAFLCRVPVRVHTFTGLIFPTTCGFRRRILMLIDKLICACATHIVPEGEGVKRQMQQFGITTKPLNVIGHGNIAGVDTRHFSAEIGSVNEQASDLKRRLGISPSDFVFCFIGRLNRDKGLLELARAFDRLPPSAHLLIGGVIDESAPVDSQTLDYFQRHSRIHLLGFLTDIRPALRASKVLVLPSYREGFPNVILQAGAMALPVIATDVSGSNEVIEPGVNGWLVPPRDADALSSAMEQAIRAPNAELIQMGLLSRSRIVARFDQQDHWLRMARFYTELSPG